MRDITITDISDMLLKCAERLTQHTHKVEEEKLVCSKCAALTQAREMSRELYMNYSNPKRIS